MAWNYNYEAKSRLSYPSKIISLLYSGFCQTCQILKKQKIAIRIWKNKRHYHGPNEYKRTENTGGNPEPNRAPTSNKSHSKVFTFVQPIPVRYRHHEINGCQTKCQMEERITVFYAVAFIVPNKRCIFRTIIGFAAFLNGELVFR